MAGPRNFGARFMFGIRVVALFGCGIAGCSGQVSEQDYKLSRIKSEMAGDYMSKKNIEAAKSELLQSIALDPDNPQAHELLAYVFFLEGVGAIDSMEIHDCLQGSARKEREAFANDRFRQAQEHLERSLKTLPEDQRPDPGMLNTLANIDLHFKRYDEAIAHTTSGLEDMIYVDKHLLLGTRGWAYYGKGDLASASRDLRQALFHRSDFCAGRHRLAKVYYEQKEYDVALEEVEAVIADTNCPIQQDALQLRGLCLVQRRQLDQARQDFQRCVEVGPKSCAAQVCQRYANLS